MKVKAKIFLIPTKNNFLAQLCDKSDYELIEVFNNDVGNPGWVAARERFHYVLLNEFDRRGFDISAIENNGSISFANKIKLVGKKIQIMEASKKR